MEENLQPPAADRNTAVPRATLEYLKSCGNIPPKGRRTKRVLGLGLGLRV